MAEIQIADVRAPVSLSMITDFENYQVFKPAPFHQKNVHQMLDQLIALGGCLKIIKNRRGLLIQAYTLRRNDKSIYHPEKMRLINGTITNAFTVSSRIIHNDTIHLIRK